MAKEKPGKLEVQSFADHHVITQPNPLRKVLLRVPESDLDDPVGRAEKALAGLSSEFKTWMTIEADRLRLDDDDRRKIAAILAERRGPAGDTFALERDRGGRHGAIMKYDLNAAPA